MSDLDIDAIKNYLIRVGCKVEYPILVNAFKKYLYNPDPQVQGKIRTQFKDFVNRLAIVKLEDNMKFLILRPEFRPTTDQTSGDQNAEQQVIFKVPEIPPKKPKRPPLERNQTICASSTRSIPTINQENVPERQNNLHRSTPNLCSIRQGSDHPPPVPRRQKSIRSIKSHREDESDSSSFQPMDQLRRRWIIEACKCNHNGLVALLREDPKLASYKDTVGYTALHWAAKTGNANIIRLLAGTYGVSPDIRSNAGYTPLHIAFMFGRNEIINLLLNYNANPSIRDYNGKRPQQLSPYRLKQA